MVNTIKFSQMNNGGDLAPGDQTPGLLSSTNVLFDNPWTFLAPGTTGDRPIPTADIYYRLRLNTTLQIYEYYDPIILMWAQLSGSGTGTVNPGVANDIAFYAANGQAVSPIASNTNALLVSDAGGIPSMSTTTPLGLSIPGATITASTAALTAGSVTAAPTVGSDLTNKTYVDSMFGSGVESITGTTNQVFASSATGNVTLSLPQDIALGSTPTFAGLTLSSMPLSIASGGTDVTTVTTLPTPSAFAGWDANSNISANNVIAGFATTVSSAGTRTLTVASAKIQEITGTLTHTVVMPVVSTLVAGQAYEIINNSTGNVNVVSSGGNTIQLMAANTTLFIECMLTSGTSATSWNASYVYDNGAGVLSITGTANQVIASASTGAVTLSLPQNIGTGNSPAFSGLVLTNPYISGAGGLHSFQIFTSGTVATYTKPANVKSILVEIWGGGGGGGGHSAAASQSATSGGGGAGGYARLYIALAGAAYTYTVGVGGSPGIAGTAGNGGNGGSTFFNASSLQATGGQGGFGGTSVPTSVVYPTLGGAGGVGSNGDLNVKGSYGLTGLTLLMNNISGGGGSSTVGSGGLPLNSAGFGSSGIGFASGGSGSISYNASNYNGGMGSGGLIIIWEFS